AHARREDVERAAQSYRLIPEAVPLNLFSYFFMAEMVAIAGTPEQATELLERVQACRDEYLVLTFSYGAWEGPRARFIALLLARLERYDEASALFEDVLRRLEQLATFPYLARTEYE